MTRTTHQQIAETAGILLSVVVGGLVGLVVLPVIAAFSPLCLWSTQAGVCSGFASGVEMVLDPLDMSAVMGIFLLYSVLITPGLIHFRE